MKPALKIGLLSNITALVAVMLFSCANPDAVISEMASDDTLSGVIADSITFFRSDSGVVRMELYAPRFVRMDNEEDVMEFPLGFHVFMYDRQHQLTTELLAGYGKSHGDELLEARDSVVVRRSEDGQVMYSDMLFWYQKQKMIYTRSHVRIITNGKDIEADSLVAQEDFSEYTMYSGSALLDVDDEE